MCPRFPWNIISLIGLTFFNYSSPNLLQSCQTREDELNKEISTLRSDIESLNDEIKHNKFESNKNKKRLQSRNEYIARNYQLRCLPKINGKHPFKFWKERILISAEQRKIMNVSSNLYKLKLTQKYFTRWFKFYFVSVKTRMKERSDSKLDIITKEIILRYENEISDVSVVF